MKVVHHRLENVIVFPVSMFIKEFQKMVKDGPLLTTEYSDTPEKVRNSCAVIYGHFTMYMTWILM